MNTKYTTIWRNKFLTTEATSITEMADILKKAGDELLAMHEAGVQLEEGGVADDYAFLYTYDPVVAQQFGMDPDEEDEEFEEECKEDEDEDDGCCGTGCGCG